MIRKILAVLLLLTTVAALAQTEGAPTYAIDSYTIDGGGGTSTGGSFSLSGTVGQPDASPVASTGGVFSMAGGFWGGGVIDFLFKDGFEQL